MLTYSPVHQNEYDPHSGGTYRKRYIHQLQSSKGKEIRISLEIEQQLGSLITQVAPKSTTNSLNSGFFSNKK